MKNLSLMNYGADFSLKQHLLVNPLFGGSLFLDYSFISYKIEPLVIKNIFKYLNQYDIIQLQGCAKSNSIL
ncbi:hypothetical protein BX659_10213 [Orenia metallireducens]|uniref:Uncharacterized protein n=1 Tax=Orenia metallireducens TaxID=1413210 RepID=A0A285F1Q7_9FIRM|nr:hypothetical protein BX659_10213 [Orenia metallireducens]SNY05225.1 hypothetical protein SAMN06265827_10113 [Orenia metallireducens]